MFPVLNKLSLRARCGAGIAACGLLAATAMAGSPRVYQTFPGGAQRGTEVEVLCSGANLADARSFLFDQPGFESQIVKAEASRFTAKIKVPANASLGEHRFRVISASGIADLRMFYVTPFPMVAEAESKVKPKPAQHVELNTTVYGHTPDDAQSKYEIDAKKGQRISVEVIGLRLHTQTPYDPYLAIAKADGTPITEVDDIGFTRQDPVASFIAPDDGKYVITIRDTTNAGPGPCQYIMNIGTFARPIAIYPMGGPAGEDVKVKLIGDAAGTIEQTVKLPEKATDDFSVYTNQTQPTPQPNAMRVSYFPNVLETKPDNTIEHATPVDQDFPVALNGIIEKKDDISFFKFKAKKDQALEFTVYARRLNSPLDSIIFIYNAKGNAIANNDDSGGPDSYLRWKAPADGDYYVSIKDQLGRGDIDYVYRLEITPVEPKLTVWLPEMTINQNQDRRAIPVPKGNRYASLVRIKRVDVAGDVQLDAESLPAGVVAHAPIVDKSVDTVPVVFEAAPEAAPGVARAFDIQTKLTETPKEGKVSTEVAHIVDVVENGNQRPYYVKTEHELPVAVIDEIPVKINVAQPKVPLLQTGSMNLKITAERKDDFKGPISISLLYGPPGIGSAGIQQIKEGENEGVVTISANPNAPLQKWKVCVIGSADFGKGVVYFSTPLIDIEVAPPLVQGKIARTFVDQGDTTTVTCKLDIKTPFEGKAKAQLLGLPPGATAEEQEFSKDDKEVKFTVKADKATPAGQHKQLFCQFTLLKDNEPMTSTFAHGGILRVDKASVAQNNSATPGATAQAAPGATAKK